MTSRAMRMKDVQVCTRPVNFPKKTLTIDADVARAIRKVARADGMRLSDFLERLLRLYLQRHHPSWKIIEHPADRPPPKGQ